MNPFEKFINSIKKTDKIAIIYHPDVDGVCSAIIVTKALERLERKPSLIFTQKAHEIEITKATITKLRKARISKLIILDLDVDQDPSTIKDVEKFAKILILDHHIKRADLNSKKTLMIKAQDISKLSGDQYCASKLSYDLFYSVVDISDLDWVAAVGIFGDKGMETWKDFLRETANKYAVNVKRFEEIEELIDYSRAAQLKIDKIFETLSSANNMSDVLQSELREHEKVVRRELEHYIKGARRLAEIHNDIELVWYEVAPKYNIKSKLASDLSIKYFPKQTVLIITKNTLADVSARRQDRKISMHELMLKGLEGIKGSGGGHIPAAGATFPSKYLELFKENIMKYLKLATAVVKLS